MCTHVENRDMSKAPKTGNILLKLKQFHYDARTGNHKQAGTCWTEGFWEPSGECWEIWCGKKGTYSTESAEPEAWSYLPAPAEEE